MTVSQRASQIYKLTKPSGGTWQQAMQQAYGEVAEQEAQREELEAKSYIQSIVQNIRNQNTGSFYNGRTLNNMIGDMVNAVVDLRYDQGLKYPYTSARTKIDDKLNEIEDLVYSYTKKDEWDASYRLPDGRISNTWWIQATDLITQLGLEPAMIEGYEAALIFFVG